MRTLKGRYCYYCDHARAPPPLHPFVIFIVNRLQDADILISV